MSSEGLDEITYLNVQLLTFSNGYVSSFFTLYCIVNSFIKVISDFSWYNIFNSLLKLTQHIKNIKMYTSKL